MLLVFDSGIGGMSIVGAIRRALPGEPITYLADCAGFPYGTLSDADLTDRLVHLLQRAVATIQPDLLVIACNTASTVALMQLRAAVPIPVIGCVPPIKPAALVSQTRCIGLLATEATVRRAYVADLTTRFASDCVVFSHGSANLASLAEAIFRGEPPDMDELAIELARLLDRPGAARIDAVALGCTHYAFLRPSLQIIAPHIQFWLDPAEAVARQTQALLTARRNQTGRTEKDAMLATSDLHPATVHSLLQLNFSEPAILSFQ